MTKRGLISIGTNSTRALVAELNGNPEVVLQRSIGTRLGEGLRDSGELQKDAMRRTLDAVESHTRAVRQLTDRLAAIATSAVRRANNAGDFARDVERITGVTLQTISGDEEARASYMGATSGLERDRTYGVVDVGGGSTEYATADDHVSCEIGAVRLTELFPKLSGEADTPTLQAAQACVREALRPLRDFDRVEHLVFVGGSATTVAAIVKRGSADEYSTLERAQLQGVITRLSSLPTERRKNIPGMIAQRADILLAGALILDEVFVTTLHEKAVASHRDLLLGYLLTH